ncbi:3-hydroxyacyl-CoA dehydrogenase [Sulfolobus acidocaldarius SUSAZ]|nr:3-hydroxyacyl-CoA dehydrogenase [Sulfolobus acidocaldarius SUSAZ]
MKVDDIKKILVVGAGTMGHGIAEVFAIAGYHVYLSDVSEDILSKSLNNIRWSLSKLKEKDRIKESVDKVLSRIIPVVGLNESIRDADFVVEASPEIIDLKRQIFSTLDKLLSPDTILATNTSTLPITSIAEVTSKPERVVAMHFFNPPVLMELVEVMKGEKTNDEVALTTYELAKKIGKKPILIKKDVPGYVVNNILGAVSGTACLLVEKGLADIKEVDAVTMYKLGFPMGVFILADYSGLDIGYNALRSREKLGLKSNRPPCSMVEEKVKKGELGVKSGKGYYQYPAPGKYQKPEIPRELAEKLNPALILCGAVNVASRMYREGIVSKEEIDLAVKLGLNYPKGIFEYADEIGIDEILSGMKTLKDISSSDFYDPDPLLLEMQKSNELGKKTGKGFYEHKKAEEKKLDTIIVRIEEPIATIILNRPERLNAINGKMSEEITSTLSTLAEDQRIRVVIITGSGKAFSAGADVTGFQQSGSPTSRAIFRKDLFSTVTKFPKPVIAAINGFALGGGLELAMACDIRIASSNAELGQPEINLALIPGGGGTQRLTRLVGRGWAKYIVYSGERISASLAREIGLVEFVVPPEKLEEEAKRIALKIAEKSPLALAAAKLAIDSTEEREISTGLNLESTLFGLLLTSEDSKEGVRAFMEKRKPQFKGV